VPDEKDDAQLTLVTAISAFSDSGTWWALLVADTPPKSGVITTKSSSAAQKIGKLFDTFIEQDTLTF
jgi:hypothetical protein